MKEHVQMDRTELSANRIAGALAMLWLPLVIVGFGVIVGFSPSITDSTADTVKYYAGLDPDRAGVGEWLETLAFVSLLVFVARVVSVARATGSVASWLGTVAVASSAAALAIASAGIAPLVALTRDDNATELPATGVAVLNDLRVVLHWLDLLVLGVMFLALGLLLRHARVLPSWLAWTAGALGVLHIAGIGVPESGIADSVVLLAGLWALIAGALVLIRPGRLVPASPAGEPAVVPAVAVHEPAHH